MNPMPAELQDRRAIEDQAIKLAEERNRLTWEMAANTWAIIELLRDPRHSMMPLDHLANLLGVSRQSLYRWREIGQKIPAELSVADAMSMRDEDGNAVYNFG
jgi:hypothetical protein